MKSFQYNWLHIPTGETGSRYWICLSRSDFLEELCKWNRLGPNWKYWE